MLQRIEMPCEQHSMCHAQGPYIAAAAFVAPLCSTTQASAAAFQSFGVCVVPALQIGFMTIYNFYAW
jgi:hypothetical protein